MMELSPFQDLVLEKMDDWVIFLDRNHRIVWVNRAARQTLASPADSLEGRPCWDAFHGLDQHCQECPLDPEKREFFPRHYEIRSPQGGSRLVTCYLVDSDEGEVVGFLIVAKDITQRARAEAERTRRKKLEGVLEMAGSAAHELSQPLQVVLTNLEMINSLHPGREEMEARLEQIGAGMDRVIRVVRKLQNITKYHAKDYLGGRIVDLDRSSARDRSDDDTPDQCP